VDGELETEDPAALEKLLFEALNAARSGEGLPALARARDLDSVARAYSREMASSKVIAHESPVSGGPGDRVLAAGISFVHLRENLAKAAGAGIAHRGLMESPGHRANILSPDVKEAGVGVAVVVEEGLAAIIVTQLFASRPQKIDPGAAAEEFLQIVNGRRERARRPPLARDKWLDGRARSALASCFDDTSLPALKLEAGGPVSKATVVGFLVGEMAAVDEAIDDDTPGIFRRDYTLVGVAVRQGRHPTMGDGVICVRAVLGGR
jgi:uncharacterized protein YkwD